MHMRCSLWAAALLFAAFGLCPAQPAAAQDQPYVIQGVVLDAQSQQPLAEVTVALSGTARGVQTDAQGQYSLLAPVPPGTYQLNFTLLGRKRATQTVQLGAQRAVEFPAVTMELTAVALDEIVVTGVAAPAERRVLGNTIETVRGEEISGAAGVSAVDQALQGKVTGALVSENSGQPGGGVTIRLRGTNSILGGAEPLYVVDGVFVDNSSEALVSLSGNAGRGDQAITNRMADIDPADIERIEVLKGAAAAALYGSRANNGVIQIFTRRGRVGTPEIRFLTEFRANTPPKKYDRMMDPRATNADVIWGGADSVLATVERFDVQDQIWRTGYSSINRLSVAGGTDVAQYYLAGSYGYEQGILEANTYKRLSFRANVTSQLSDRVEVSARAGYIKSEADYVIEGEQANGGVLTSIVFGPTSWDANFDEDLGRHPYNPILGSNPLDVLENWDTPEKVSRFQGSIELKAEPFRNVTVRYLAGLDDYRQESKLLRPPGSVSASDGGLVQNPVRFSRLFNNDVSLSHLGQATPSLGFTTTLGFRYTDDRSEVIRATASDLPPEQTLVGGATQSASQSVFEFRTVDWFLEERVAISDRLYLTGGVNLNASSAFGPDERWQLFPRASVSYLLGETDFWQNALGGTISSMRLRGAFGQTGGQPPGLYSRFENYFDIAYGGLAGLVPSNTAGNPNLKPERQTEFEFGLDAGLFSDRANLEFTYYNKKTTDLVLAVPAPPSLGFQSQFQNIGELSNRGWEAALNTVNISSSSVSWRMRLQLAANRSKVQKLVTSADTLISGYLNAVVEGQPIGVYYGGIYARDASGNIVYDAASLPVRARDTLPDGSTPFARRIIGDPNPDLIASLGNELDVGRHITISFLFEGRFGNDVANFTRRITEYFGSDQIVEREVNGDTIPRTFVLNPNGRINVYEEYIEDGTFVKLRELAVQFRFDQPWIRRIGAQSMTLRLAGRNLLTFTGYRGLDPETNMFSASTVARSVDFATTPLPRSFAMSLGLNF